MKLHTRGFVSFFGKWRSTLQLKMNGVLLNAVISHRIYKYANGIYINISYYITPHAEAGV
jgi:hypothetical protein